MGFSKKYIRATFKEQGVQLSKKALIMLESRLKLHADWYALACKDREFKRLDENRLHRLFKIEDLKQER